MHVESIPKNTDGIKFSLNTKCHQTLFLIPVHNYLIFNPRLYTARRRLSLDAIVAVALITDSLSLYIETPNSIDNAAQNTNGQTDLTPT